MPRKRKEGSHAEVDLPITPMLDMAFQLLVFFVFTYKPSNFEQADKVKLLPPETVQRTQAQKSDVPSKNKSISTDTPPEENVEDITIIVDAETPKSWQDRLEAARTSRDRARRISADEYVKEKALLAKDIRNKETGKACDRLGKPIHIALRQFNPQTTRWEVKDLLSADKRITPEEGRKALSQELQDILRGGLKGGGLPETVRISNDDGGLAYEQMLLIDDICKGRYGVQKDGRGEFVREKDGKVHLEKILDRRKDKQFAQVLQFNQVKKLLPNVLVEGPKEPKR
jgi:biopolymer transport protein ExbD